MMLRDPPARSVRSSRARKCSIFPAAITCARSATRSTRPACSISCHAAAEVSSAASSSPNAAQQRHQHHEGRNPHHARAVAVVRAGDDAADEGVAEQGQRHGRRQQRQIVQPAIRRAQRPSSTSSASIEASATGTCSQLMRAEIEAPLLLPRRAHRRDLRRDVALDDAVGVRDPAIGAFAGRHMQQLLPHRAQGRARPARPDSRRATARRWCPSRRSCPSKRPSVLNMLWPHRNSSAVAGNSLR